MARAESRVGAAEPFVVPLGRGGGGAVGRVRGESLVLPSSGSGTRPPFWGKERSGRPPDVRGALRLSSVRQAHGEGADLSGF